MKTKLLSFLLLFAMLVTGIPFAVSAEETPTEGAQDETPAIRTEYHDLYVGDALVGLFTAFAGDETVSLSDGKGVWTNRVTGGAAATFGGTTGWTQGKTGGVGYTLVYGEMDTVAGSYSASSTHTTLDRDNRLIFDLGLLPTEDFTVEYLARYTPVYAYDTATETLVDAFAQNISGYDTPLSGIYTPVDAVGFLCSYTTHRGGYFNSAGIAATLGLVRWRSVDKAGYQTWESNGYGWGDSLVTANRTTRKVEAYAITRDETTVTADAATTVTATYTHFFNAAKVCAASYSSANTTGEYRYYTFEDNTEFYLSRMLGTDFYAVRIYSDVLTAEEMKHNRAVDAMNYYAVEIPEDALADEKVMARITDTLAVFPLETDATAYAVRKTEAQSAVDKALLKFTDLHDLYVKDGLTLLFTTFGDYASSVDLTGGKWTDIISGKTATLQYSGKNTWVRNANGSVGFTVFRGAYTDTDGDGVREVTADSAGTDTYTATANRLQLGIALLPESDFTVEYLAMYKPLYVYDAEAADGIARDGEGNKRETFLEGISVGLHVEREIDELGWFSSRASLLDTTKHYWQGENAVERGSVHWFYNCHYWSYDSVAGGAYNNQYYLGANGAHAPASGLNIPTDAFQTNGVVRTYGISLDETLTVASDGTRTTEALFSLYRNASLYNSNASYINTTARGEDARGGYIDIDTPYITATSSTCSRTHDFWLSSTRATDFFGVRVYDKALTEAERRQNHAVDALLYYGVDLPDSLKSDAAAMSRIYAAIGDVALATDSTEAAVARIRILTIVNAEIKRGSLLDLYAASEHLTALFTTFYPSTLDLSAKTWTDLVSGKTASLATVGISTWHMTEEGGVGFHNYYGVYADSDGDGVKDVAATNKLQQSSYKGSRLQMGLSLLPESDFSVEYLAMYQPLYVYDATEADYIARDENGVKMESANEGLITPLHVQYSIDQLGWFTSFASHLDSTKNYWSGVDTVQRGSVHWQFDCPRWDYGHNSWYVGGKGHGATGGLNLPTDAFQTNGVVRTYGIYLDETLTVASDGTRTTEALFSLYRNASLYNSNASAISTTANATGGKAYYDIDTPFVSGEHNFWLSSTRPTDFFTVRVYDVALSDEEKKQNYAVDMMLYFGVTVSDELLANDSMRRAILTIFARETAVTDATARLARHITLQAKIDELEALLSQDTALSSLYAREENLVALYTSYEHATVHTDVGVWVDLVGGNAALLGNPDEWRISESGAVGYDLFYGMMGEDGTYTASSSFNNYDVKGTRLEFGIDVLPKGDFTVEYVAKYRPVSVADAKGGIAKDASGNPLETVAVNPVGTATDGSTVYNTPGSQQYGGNATAPVDQLGFFHSWTTNRDGKFSNTGIRGGVYWCYGDVSAYEDAWSAYYWSQTFFKTGEAFYQRDAVHSYAIRRAKSTDDTGLVTATYSLLRDGTAYASAEMNQTLYEAHSRNTTGKTLDFANDDAGYFYLAERLPVDFFGVRIYNVALSDAERARNRFVDLAYYYGVSLPDFVRESDAVIEKLATKLATLSFATDATAYAANKLTVEREIEALAAISSTNTLYVQEGLTALFTAFAGEGALLSASGNDLLWSNRVLKSAGNATFEKTGWTYDTTLGGVGYDLVYGTVDTEKGTFSASCSQDTYARGNRLNLGLSLLPKEDFTLEYVAYYSPVLSYDTATETLVDTYATGISDAKTPTAGVYEPVDTVGFLSSYTTQHGGLFYVDSNVYVLGLLRWRSMDKDGYKTWEANGYGWGGSLVTANRATRTVETYAITRAEETVGDAVTAVYTHRLNGAFVDDNSFSSANTTGEHRYYAFEDDTEFYLSYKLGTTFYALRVYDRVLTEAEQAQNRVADTLGFYGVAVPDGFRESGERYAYVSELCAQMTLERDATRYNANRVLLTTAVSGEGSTVTVSVEGTETVDVVYGDKYLLPEVASEKTVFAWQVTAADGTRTSHAPGEIIPVDGDLYIRALLFGAPETKYGVTVKPMGDDGFGMRFAATVDKAEYLALAEEYGKGYIRLSMLITPKQYVDRAGAFTREALRKYVETHAGDPARAFIEIPMTGFYTVDEDVCTMVGTVYNFTAVTREKDPLFAAIACVEVDTDRDGTVDRTVYGSYNAATCRSPKRAVEGASYGNAALTDTQRLWLDDFLEYYRSKTYGEEGDKTVQTQRDEIKNAFESAMDTVVDYTVHPFAEGEVAEKYAHIQAISFDGLTTGGKKTRIFAYLGLPEGASAESPVPAVVLVHGGGGHAYMEWVRLWNERGYAAIAMENTGYFPVTPGSCPIDSNATAAREFPDYILDVIDESAYVIAPIGDNRFTTSYAEVDTQWQYHGLSSVILSHNVLRGQAAVDASRIGTVGVSWGGTMVSQVIGYDTRYAFAIPAYGSAYLGEPERPFGSYDNAYVDALWAAERNLDNFKNPILWFDWADDNNFVVNAYSNSYMHSLKNNAKTTFVLLKDWGHSHNHVWNKEHGYAFADSICFPESAPSYARFTSQPEGQDLSSTVALPAGATNVKARFHYLTEPMVYKTFNKLGSLNSSFLAEYWKTNATDITIDPATGALTGTVPENVRAYYISVTYEVNGVSLETSSRFVMVR